MNLETFIRALSYHLYDRYQIEVKPEPLRGALNDLGLTLVPAEENPD